MTEFFKYVETPLGGNKNNHAQEYVTYVGRLVGILKF